MAFAQAAIALRNKVIDARDIGVDRLGVFAHHMLRVIRRGHRVTRRLLRGGGGSVGAVGGGVGARGLKLRPLGRLIGRGATGHGQ